MDWITVAIRCWINEGNYVNVLVYPVCVSTMLNLLFLFNIVRVLLMKLRAGPAIGTRPSRALLQAFRFFSFFYRQYIWDFFFNCCFARCAHVLMQWLMYFYLVIRATLLLVPLLGLHYLVILFRPPKKHSWEHFYEVLSALTASFQVGAFRCIVLRLK